MKNLILLITVALFSTKLLSQDITYFFLNLPDSCLLGFSKQDREKIVNNHSEEMDMNGQPFIFKAEDEKFGYLIGPFDAGVCLKIWEISNGDKLIAVHKSNGTVGICHTEFHFYIYDGMNFNYLNNEDVFPNEDFEQNFFKGENEQNIILSQEDSIFYRCITYSISPKSSNMVVYYFLTDDYEKI
jgi:hypothetical protein